MAWTFKAHSKARWLSAFVKTALVIFGAVLIPNLCLAQESLPITVSQAVWTDGVSNLQFQKQLDDTASRPPVYLWLKLQAGPQVLDALRNAGAFPIKLRWTWFVGEGGQGTVGTLIDQFSLNAGRDAQLDALADEVRRKGYFEWRTWGTKQNMQRGQWQVDLIYAAGPQRGQPVLCGPDAQVCRYRIKIN